MTYEEKCINAFEEELKQFLLVSKRPNLYLHGNSLITVYCRKAFHLIDDEARTTFDIANITIHRPGKGIGRRVIELIHQHNPFQVTYIESIQNDRFYAFLKREGWIDAHPSEMSKKFSIGVAPCVYKSKLS